MPGRNAGNTVEPIPYQHGIPLEGALARRERLATDYATDFGQERVFPELVENLLKQVPEGANLLEVGAATGLLTRPLLQRASHVTALEPSAGMLKRLLASDVSDSPHLTIKQGMVEDLLHDESYDVAVVTFTPRRGLGLMRLLLELAHRVRDRVIMLLEDDPSMDWAYLARTAASQGFDVTLRIVSSDADRAEDRKHAVLMLVRLGSWVPTIQPVEDWALEAREISVPYPAPRGAATRLVRYFMAGGDRAVVVVTDARGVERLYGNLRTAVHRLGRDEVTVRRQEDLIQLVRLPKGVHTST